MKVGFIGVPGANIGTGYLEDSRSIINLTGQNTGNLAFWFGFSNILPENIIRVFWNDNPALLKSKIDVLVISAANFLREGSDLKQLAKLVSVIDKPVLVAGLGAESQDENSIPELLEGTIDFLKQISKRCDYFGVRGEFTQRVCQHYGITNAKVLGCPSIFINDNKNLGTDIQGKWNRPINRFSTASASIKGNLRGSELRLVREAMKRNSSYILQRPFELFKCAFSENLDLQDQKYIARFSNYVGMTSSELKEFLSRQGYVFTSAESWLDFIRHSTHTINTRIHGTILPIMSEVPSICITHDTRTRELCEALKLTSIPARIFGKSPLSLEEIYQNYQFDGERFDDNRRYLASEYKQLFNSLGIKPSSTLLNW